MSSAFLIEIAPSGDDRMFRQKNAAAGIILAVFATMVFPCLALAQTTFPSTDNAGGGPSVFFPVKAFEFQPVIDGVNVVYDFIVLNKGSTPLLISNVRTG
jgi:hypothetical protein